MVNAPLSTQEGDYRDVAETEKGTAGIPRRVGVAAASALKAVMQQHGIGGPKDINGGKGSLFSKGFFKAFHSLSTFSPGLIQFFVQVLSMFSRFFFLV